MQAFSCFDLLSSYCCIKWILFSTVITLLGKRKLVGLFFFGLWLVYCLSWFVWNTFYQPLSCWTRIYPAFTNSVHPDQLASEEANWSGSILFVIQHVNIYQQPGSSKLTGWQLEMGRHRNLFSMTRVKCHWQAMFYDCGSSWTFSILFCGYHLFYFFNSF